MPNDDFKYFNIVEEKYRGNYCPVWSYQADDGEVVEFSILNKPEHIDENTPIVFYYSGGGDYSRADYNAAYQGLQESGNCVALVIGGDVKYPENNMRILEGISKEFGIPSENYNSIAFSMGVSIALKTASLLKRENPDFDSGILAFADPNELKLKGRSEYTNYTEYKDWLKDYKFLIFNGGADCGRVKDYTDLDLNWINAYSFYSKFPNYRNDINNFGDHQINNYRFFRDGGINYIVNGTSKFNDLYNINIDEYRRKNDPVMKALRKRRKKILNFSPIKCNNKFVETETNDLINQIKSFSFFNTLDSGGGYGSTTIVPNIESEYLSSYYNQVFDVMDDLLVNVNNTILVSNNYERMQNKQLNILNEMDQIERL